MTIRKLDNALSVQNELSNLDFLSMWIMYINSYLIVHIEQENKLRQPVNG